MVESKKRSALPERFFNSQLSTLNSKPSTSSMNFAIELDVDRVAYVSLVGREILRVFVDEDMHYPLEPERRRAATAAELEVIRARLAAGEGREIPALPPVPSLI